MSLTENAVRNPAAVAVAVGIVLLLDLVSLGRLPVQLFPDIERPQMSVVTSWRASSPHEIESEILKPQEEVLQGLPGLEELDGTANQGMAFIRLELALGTDMQATLLEVISRLQRVPPLPADANPPVVSLGGGFGGGGAEQVLTWFFVQKLPGSPGDIEDYQQFIEERVKPAFEAVPGVSTVNVNANGGRGSQDELQILINPERAAALGVPVTDLISRVGRANDVSGGSLAFGRRQYALRFVGRYSPEELGSTVIHWRDGSPVRLRDIAEVIVARGERTNFAYQNNNPAMGIRIDRQSGANVLATLTEVKRVAAELNAGPLQAEGLSMAQSFDPSVFIMRAVNLLTGNLGLGVLLAVLALWWFLRDVRATVVIALAIPISLAATLLVLALTGRSLNAISLAGLAFAVGMVLDAAIVVAEAIVARREAGLKPLEAALAAAARVRGALLASTATTVAIFLPVLFLEGVEGQLFADLALTIAIAVAISMLVALTVLPTAARMLLNQSGSTSVSKLPTTRVVDGVMRLTATPRRRWSWAIGLIAGGALLSWALLPSLDYLPPVKRDAIDVFINPPPGLPPEVAEREIFKPMMERLRPYMDGEKEPALRNYYILGWPGGGTLGIRALDQSRVKELEQIVRTEIISGFPDVRAFAAQGNLFGGMANDRSIAIHLQSRDVEALAETAREGQRLLTEAFPGAVVNAFPPPDFAAPEIRVRPDDRRLSEVGWNRSDVAQVIRAFGDGVWLGEHFDGEHRLDILLRAEGWDGPEALARAPVATPTGAILPLGELVAFEQAVGPASLRRVDGRRTITLGVAPPEDMSLEDAMNVVRAQVEPALREAMPIDGSLRYGGSADSLAKAMVTMGGNFIIALILLLMLMAALFRSLKDSMLVMLTVPLATVGGVIGLRLANLFTLQPLDLLTMIGFVILLGLTVNNAILLVDRTRANQREGLDRDNAVRAAVAERLRPILMSTSTTLLGMLPLVLIPGPGSVIYRGLAVVIVGGMSLSLVFTLILLPALLRMGDLGWLKRRNNEAVEGDEAVVGV